MAKKTNLEVLIESSWKVNLAVSIILYIIYLVLRNSNIKAGFFNIGPIIAPALKFLSIIIFFIAVISFFVSLLKNQKFKNTISLDDIKKLS